VRTIVKYSVLATFATAMILLAAALAFAQPPDACISKAEFESSIPMVDNLARQLEELEAHPSGRAGIMSRPLLFGVLGVGFESDVFSLQRRSNLWSSEAAQLTASFTLGGLYY
jgi:hypothetical protein